MIFAGYSTGSWRLGPAPKTWPLKVLPRARFCSSRQAPFHVYPVCVLILVLLEGEGQAGKILEPNNIAVLYLVSVTGVLECAFMYFRLVFNEIKTESNKSCIHASRNQQRDILCPKRAVKQVKPKKLLNNWRFSPLYAIKHCSILTRICQHCLHFTHFTPQSFLALQASGSESGYIHRSTRYPNSYASSYAYPCRSVTQNALL